MKKLHIVLLMAVAVALSPFSASAKINIFACEPEWQSLAQEIGKKNVTTFSATSATQDPHYIRAKPSLIAKIRKADLLICSGSDLEVGWLPILLTKTNKNLQIGQDGHLMAADFVPKIGKPKVLDRSLGDIHPQGNPHIHLDPYNILLVADELKKRLQKIDAINSANYQANYQNFVERWQKSIKKWEKKAETLKNVKVLPHHKSFSYLLKWLKMDGGVALEVKPGIAPNPSHLRKLLKYTQEEKVRFIILSPFDSQDASNWMAQKSGIEELVLPYTIGGNGQSKDLFTLFDSTIDLMLKNKR
jgi:zinc/manganese transport system substrate-binding protein